MKRILSSLLLWSIVVSCQQRTPTESQESKALSAERRTFFDNLLAPADAAAQLKASRAAFDPGKMSDATSFALYRGNDVKAAVNMGIYLSDLNYCIAYNQPLMTKDYFTAAHELSKAIGVEERLLSFLMKRYTDNINQNDSVRNVVTDLLAKSTRDLQGTDREKLAGLAIAGYQIENLHLALGVLESYHKGVDPKGDTAAVMVPLFRMVLDQRTNVAFIYNFLNTISDPLDPDKNPNYPFYANAFKELIDVYKRLDAAKGQTDDTAEKLMNEAVVAELSEKVNTIRTKIISAE